MSMIRQLSFGNVGNMDSMRVSSRAARVCGGLDKANEKLIATLNDEQKTMFKVFVKKMDEYSAEECEDVYKYAFSIGLGLGYESCKVK